MSVFYLGTREMSIALKLSKSDVYRSRTISSLCSDFVGRDRHSKRCHFAHSVVSLFLVIRRIVRLLWSLQTTQHNSKIKHHPFYS